MYKGRKRERKEEAIKRTEASILSYEELMPTIPRIDPDIGFNPEVEKKRLKKKIERAKITIENTTKNIR